MSRKRISTVALVVMLVLLALSTQIALADPPASSGPHIVRYLSEPDNGFYAFFIPDERTGLSAIVGADVVADCLGDPAPFDMVYIQEVDIPEDPNRISQLVTNGEATTTVWATLDFDCDYFTSVAPVASGTSNMRYTDNDVLTFLTDDNVNSNAFGLMANGTLYDSDGNTVRFSAHSRWVWDGVDTIKNVNEKVNVH